MNKGDLCWRSSKLVVCASTYSWKISHTCTRNGVFEWICQRDKCSTYMRLWDHDINIRSEPKLCVWQLKSCSPCRVNWNVAHQAEEQAKAAKHQAIEFEQPPGKERKCSKKNTKMDLMCDTEKKRFVVFSTRSAMCLTPPSPPSAPSSSSTLSSRWLGGSSQCQDLNQWWIREEFNKSSDPSPSAGSLPLSSW